MPEFHISYSRTEWYSDFYTVKTMKSVKWSVIKLILANSLLIFIVIAGIKFLSACMLLVSNYRFNVCYPN